MTVYVGPVIVCQQTRRWRWNQVAHLYADSDAELLDFAIGIGLKVGWFQPGAKRPHFDLTPSMRTKAVRAGAVEHDVHQEVEFHRKLRGVGI